MLCYLETLFLEPLNSRVFFFCGNDRIAIVTIDKFSLDSLFFLSGSLFACKKRFSLDAEEI